MCCSIPKASSINFIYSKLELFSIKYKQQSMGNTRNNFHYPFENSILKKQNILSLAIESGSSRLQSSKAGSAKKAR